MRKISLIRITLLLLFFVLLTVILYYGKQVLVLLFFATFLAMLMAPVSNSLERIKIPRVFTTIISVLIIILIITGVLWMITAQVVSFAEELPKMEEKFHILLSNFQSWFEEQFGISPVQQIETINKQADSIIAQAGALITKIVSGTFSIIGKILLVIVFTFLFLLHREKYEEFFIKVFKGDDEEKTRIVIDKICKVGQQYLVGRAITIVILTVFYTIGLLIIGIKNAFLLSALAAIVTFIPYVGPLLGGAFPVLMALVTEDSFGPALWVIVVLSLAQTIDNYYISPVVIGGNINISPFFTIFILIVGGLLWGLAGVILFLPVLGIVKIIFDSVEGLGVFGFLIGDQNIEGEASNPWKKFRDKYLTRSKK